MEDREKYDLDILVKRLEKKNDNDQWEELEAEFNKEGNLWVDVYNKDLLKFKTAFDSALNTYNYHKRNGKWPEIKIGLSKVREKLTLEEKQRLKGQILARDEYKCLCCNQNERTSKLEMDHIKPDSMNGATSLENLQTLCSECNFRKNMSEIDFRNTISPLDGPKEELRMFERHNYEPMEYILKRIINFFYHSQAVSDIYEKSLQPEGKKSGKKVNRPNTAFVIELYKGNNPAWLNKYKKQLIKYLRDELGSKDIEEISIKEK